MDEIILASQSTGRKGLFDKYFAHYRVEVSDFDEESLDADSPFELTERLAWHKAKEIAKKFPSDIIFGFDTLVLCEGKILGKPATKEEAAETLRFLSGREQDVVSGYAVVCESRLIEISGFEITRLLFATLTEEYIRHYTENNPVTRYAGAYALQENDRFVRIIEGSADNIIGAPMGKVIDILRQYSLTAHIRQ